MVALAAPSQDGVDNWEPWLAATTQYHRRWSYRISLVWEKIKIPNSKYGFY